MVARGTGSRLASISARLVVAAIDVPAGTIGTPMTFVLEGLQHIAVTVGGTVPELIAFVLSSEAPLN